MAGYVFHIINGHTKQSFLTIQIRSYKGYRGYRTYIIRHRKYGNGIFAGYDPGNNNGLIFCPYGTRLGSFCPFSYHCCRRINLFIVPQGSRNPSGRKPGNGTSVFLFPGSFMGVTTLFVIFSKYLWITNQE